MATRFRLTSSTTAPAVSPAIQTYTHDQGSRRKLLTTDASALTTSAYDPDAADDLVLGDSHHIQFVSDPMDSGLVFTSGNTLKFAIQATEPNGGCNMRHQIFVSIVDSAGTTVQATIRSKTVGAAPNEFATTLTSRFRSLTLDASYTTVAGDRLVVEFSAHGTPTGGAGVNAHNSSMRWGSDGASGDLLENDTQTATDLNPWIEFVTNITFQSGAVTGTIAVTQDAQTAAITATETIPGTIASTQENQVAALSGIVANPVTGTVAAIQADQTAAFAGTVTVLITGTIAVTQDGQTASFTGTVANPVTGTVAVTQSDQTMVASGLLTITGTFTATQDAQTAAFSGTVANPVIGTIGVTQANQTAAFVGFMGDITFWARNPTPYTRNPTAYTKVGPDDDPPW